MYDTMWHILIVVLLCLIHAVAAVPHVSVIIPTYERSLLLLRHAHNLEVVVSDDSTLLLRGS